jgi:type II secretory pathway pseudopilin PulG
MRRRTAFTIIELLVSMALIVFIMAILAEAFVEGLKTFRNMKAIGDLNARLRMAQSMLRDDLSKDHFEGKRRLSDPYFWTFGPPKEGFFRVWHGSQLYVPTPPAVITPGVAPFYIEGTADGIPSYYATDHSLQYTVKKRGNNRQDFYSAAVPANSPLLSLGTPDSRYQDQNANGTLASYNSQWVEVAWFLRPTGTTAGALPLFTLYRRQRVVVPSTVYVNATTGAQSDLNYQAPGPIPVTSKPDYLEVSTSLSAKGTLFFNSPRDLTIPQRRFGMNPDPNSAGLPYHPYNKAVPSPLNANSLSQVWYPILALGPNPPLTYQSPNWRQDDEDGTAALQNNGTPSLSMEGQDVILTDVLSFAVIPIFSGLPTADFPPQNVNFPPGVSVFDTWSSQADDVYDYTLWDTNEALPTSPTLVPNKGVVTGLQISIRVWDAKTTQTRQITIIQDL